MEQKNGYYIHHYKLYNALVEEWYLNGKRHRLDGPAYIRYFPGQDIISEVEIWYLNGKQHRADGPAYIIHNISGSSHIEEYWIHDKRHRPIEQGPAKIYYGYDSDEGKLYYATWFINGVEISREKVEQFILEYKLHIYNTACLYFDEKALANIISDYSIEEI